MKINKWATFSPDRKRRLALGRFLVGSAKPYAVFGLLNPSTAAEDAEDAEDATTRRLWRFATSWTSSGTTAARMSRTGTGSSPRG